MGGLAQGFWEVAECSCWCPGRRLPGLGQKNWPDSERPLSVILLIVCFRCPITEADARRAPVAICRGPLANDSGLRQPGHGRPIYQPPSNRRQTHPTHFGTGMRSHLTCSYRIFMFLIGTLRRRGSVSFANQITTWGSFCAILLREARVERNLHQAQVADALGQTASAWTKVEIGKSPLQFETLFRVCSFLRTQPSTVMGVAERYGMIFQQHGWGVLFSQPNSLEQDHLLELAQAYWSSPGGRNASPVLWMNTSILGGPTYNPDGTMSIAPVFQYALDYHFRKMQNDYVPVTISLPPPLSDGGI